MTEEKYDYQTSTIDGAEGYARLNHKSDIQLDAEEEFRHDDGYDDDGECHCSDPGCPCDGIKYGRP